MQWSKIKITRWISGDYRITEDDNQQNGRPYRLDSPFPEAPQFFATLDGAKAHAALQNELALFKEDNARLRAELDAKNGVWPPPLEDEDAAAAQAYEALMEREEDLSDGMLMDAKAAREERATTIPAA